MVETALAALQEAGRKGVSGRKILKFITHEFAVVNEEKARKYINKALVKGVQDGRLKQVAGAGAAGSFRLATVPVKEDAKKSAARKIQKNAKKVAAKKPQTKKAAPKKPAAKKPAVKKTPAKRPAAAAKAGKKFASVQRGQTRKMN